MIFTTQIFLFMFFPICLFSYIIINRLSACKNFKSFAQKLRLKDILLILFSFGFYMWSGFRNAFRLLFYILIVYLFGLWIHVTKNKGYYLQINQDTKNRTDTGSKRLYIVIFPFIITVFLILFCLIYYNYTNFIIDCWNKLFGDNIATKSLLAPLGISFITFSAISYLTDIYRGHATSGSFIDCLLYLSFFPKIISGPIVLWKDFQPQIKTYRFSFPDCVDGINRIMTGFAKKVILADTFGACLAEIQLTGIDRVTAVGTLILYTLQIYYDFSGYSDIAIGISNLFGFKIKANFNFPYRSKSISEFWRRWHISLGTWFREYVYFPLGGNRKGQKRTVINLAVIFALTGIWHGAGWNYILWGFINGVFVIFEHQKRDRHIAGDTLSLKKTCLKNALRHIGTMLIVTLFWQLFRYHNISDVFTLFKIIAGKLTFENIPYTWQYYFDLRIFIFTILGIIGATLIGSERIRSYHNKLIATKTGYFLQELFLISLFILSIVFMVNSTYSPFIYFQY